MASGLGRIIAPGGAGRHALWLASQGLDVTLSDVSDVALYDPNAGTWSAATSMRQVRAEHGVVRAGRM